MTAPTDFQAHGGLRELKWDTWSDRPFSRVEKGNFTKRPSPPKLTCRRLSRRPSEGTFPGVSGAAVAQAAPAELGGAPHVPQTRAQASLRCHILCPRTAQSLQHSPGSAGPRSATRWPSGPSPGSGHPL